MLTTVIIIFREFLEAALLVSLLTALHARHHLYRTWMVVTLLPAIVGAFLYAKSLANIGEWFDGSGQEVTNSVFLLSMAICLSFQIIGFSFFYRNQPSHSNNPIRHILLTLSAMLIIIMAITREGAEIFVYYSSINIHPDKASSMLIGGIIGAGLGICTGVLTFVLLYQLTIKNIMIAISTLLIFITAGLVMEATGLLIQAGFIPTEEPLWNSSHLIAESSVVGQLLYATFAYEATPTLEEVSAWLLTTVSLFSLLAWIYFGRRLHRTT